MYGVAQPLAASDRLLVADAERRILRACRTIRALPDREAGWRRMRGQWPEVVRDLADAYGYTEATIPRFVPTPADVSDCLVALAWARVLHRHEFRLIWWKSFGVSYRAIADRLGRSHEHARQRYRDAILRIWYEASR